MDFPADRANNNNIAHLRMHPAIPPIHNVEKLPRLPRKAKARCKRIRFEHRIAVIRTPTRWRAGRVVRVGRSL